MNIEPEDGDIDTQVKMIIKICAADGKRKVKGEVLISLIASNDPKEGAKMIFQAFDTNDDGYICKQELTKMFREMMDDELTNISTNEKAIIFKEMTDSLVPLVDNDKDGKLSYEEFSNLLEQMDN